MYKISKTDRRLNGTIQLPFSRNISNRLLLLHFLHPARVSFRNLSAADDTVLLESLLHRVRQSRENPDQHILNLDAGNSGTVMRLMLALLSTVPGSYVLKGDQRLLKRPVRSLVTVLQELGADIEYLQTPGFLPLYIKGRNLISREVVVDASESSQHISGLLLISTILDNGINLRLDQPMVSRPYVEMTCKILELCGVQVVRQGDLIRVYPGKIKKTEIPVERDWSSASFWFAMLAIAEEGKILFPGLKRTGLQGDEILVEIFSQLGVQSEETEKGLMIMKERATKGIFEWDFRDCPAIALPVIVTCALKGRESVFRGLEGLRHKESDRISSIRQELQRFNADLIPDESGTWQLIPVKTRKRTIQVSPDTDHRIIMSLMCAAMAGYYLEVAEPDVVSKSYTGFWRDMQLMGFIIK